MIQSPPVITVNTHTTACDAGCYSARPPVNRIPVAENIAAGPIQKNSHPIYCVTNDKPRIAPLCTPAQFRQIVIAPIVDRIELIRMARIPIGQK